MAAPATDHEMQDLVEVGFLFSCLRVSAIGKREGRRKRKEPQVTVTRDGDENGQRQAERKRADARIRACVYVCMCVVCVCLVCVCVWEREREKGKKQKVFLFFFFLFPFFALSSPICLFAPLSSATNGKPTVHTPHRPHTALCSPRQVLSGTRDDKSRLRFLRAWCVAFFFLQCSRCVCPSFCRNP